MIWALHGFFPDPDPAVPSSDSSIRAAVICGTARQPDAALNMGLAMCRHVCQKHGETQVYEPLRNLIFGSYNWRIPEAKTPFDWFAGMRKS
ncbi:MAG: hypothetical protein ACLSHU_03815 [Oscillospiraceae bacterium]